MSDFQKGDIVVVVGIKSTVEGDIQQHQRLATVLEVGKDDIFAMDCNQTSFSRGSFKVSKRRCAKVILPIIGVKNDVLIPRAGDLVLSLTENYGSSKIEKKSGILQEVNDTPWESKRAKILSGAKYEDVSYDSLIVLER